MAEDKLNMGWICPFCLRGCSPDVKYCDCKEASKVIYQYIPFQLPYSIYYTPHYYPSLPGYYTTYSTTGKTK